MKIRVLFLVIITSCLFSTNSDAQFNKWKKKLQKSSLVRKTRKAVNQVDPKAYVARKINENFYLSSQLQNIKSSYYKLERTLDNNVKLYNHANYQFHDGFKTKSIKSEQLAFLNTAKINQQFPVIINFEKHNYKLYKGNNFILANGENKMPTNSELEKIIQTACWASQTNNLNPEYISNLKTLAKLNSEFYGYMLLFYDGCVNIFDKLGSIGYGGITAEQLINQYSNSLGNGFSMSGTRSSFNTYRSDLKEMQNLSKRIHKGCNTFQSVKHNLSNTRNANYQDVQSSLKDFTTIAQDINTLADGIQEQKKVISNTRKQLSQLSSFYGISFIEDIGNLYKYLEDYYAKIEIGTRRHASNFNKYVDDISLQSATNYKLSKQTFDNIAKEQIKNELPNVESLLVLQNNIATSEFRNITSNGFVSYLNKVKSQNSEMLAAIEVDFIEFEETKATLIAAYNSFPVKQAEEYYASTLAAIDKKQIIGGKYSEKYLPGIEAKLSSFPTKASINQVIAFDKNLDTYYKKAKSNNYLFAGLLLGVIAISVLVFIFREKVFSKNVLAN